MANRYTDAVLTVIAACLLILVLRPIFEPSTAHADAVPPPDEVVKVNIVEIAGWKLLSRSALPVEIQGGPVPVEIQGGASGPGCH